MTQCLAQATLSLSQRPAAPETSSLTRPQFLAAVETVKEHIQAGDVFQLVLSQRFERRTFADPFEIYRSGMPFAQGLSCCCLRHAHDAVIGP